MRLTNSSFHPLQYLAAWLVHLFTASAAFVGILTLFSIYKQEYTQALILMALAVFIDAIDGTFARLVQVKKVLPKIDGALLDNIVDYLNYVITPCFFILVKPNFLPISYAELIVAAVAITSAYQFCQDDAKTPDHFFKGFPCYWNIAIFYMFILNTSTSLNALLLITLCVLIFVPVKYVYPSRLDYLTESKVLKIIMHASSLVYGVSTAFLLIDYPNTNKVWLTISLSYVVMYLFLSFYRTYTPLIIAKIHSARNSLDK